MPPKSQVKINVQPNEISVRVRSAGTVLRKEPLFQKLKTLFEETVSKLRSTPEGWRKESFGVVLTDIESLLSPELRASVDVPQLDTPKALPNHTANTLQSMIHSFLCTRANMVSKAAASSLLTKTQNCIQLNKLRSKILAQNQILLEFMSETASDQIKLQFQEKWLDTLLGIKQYLESKLGQKLGLDLDELIKASTQIQEDVDIDKIKDTCLEDVFMAEMRNQDIFRDIFNIQRERSIKVQSGDLEDIATYDIQIQNLKSKYARDPKLRTLPSPVEVEAQAQPEPQPEPEPESESDDEAPSRKNVKWDEMLHFDDDDEDMERRREEFSQIPHVHAIQTLIEIQIEFEQSTKILHDFKNGFKSRLRNSFLECWARSLSLIQKQEDAEFRTMKHDLETKLRDIDAKVHTLSDELLQLDPGAEPAISLLHSNYNLTVDLSRDVVFSKYLTALWNLISKFE